MDCPDCGRSDGGHAIICPYRQPRRDMGIYDSNRDEILERVQQPQEHYSTPPIQVFIQEDLTYFAEVVGARYDWHEPDEQELTAQHFGTSFDNAGFWGDPELIYSNIHEQHVVLSVSGCPMVSVNLATLFAWATKER